MEINEALIPDLVQALTVQSIGPEEKSKINNELKNKKEELEAHEIKYSKLDSEYKLLMDERERIMKQLPYLMQQQLSGGKKAKKAKKAKKSKTHNKRKARKTRVTRKRK